MSELGIPLSFEGTKGSKAFGQAEQHAKYKPQINNIALKKLEDEFAVYKADHVRLVPRFTTIENNQSAAKGEHKRLEDLVYAMTTELNKLQKQVASLMTKRAKESDMTDGDIPRKKLNIGAKQ